MQNNPQPQDMTTMNASQLGNAAMQSLNSPDVQTAQGAVNSANQSYNTQLGDNATLPQMLSNSLNGSLDNPNDPNRQQTQSDLASLLTAVSNPSNAVTQAENTVPGAILPPGEQGNAMAEQIGRAGSALSMDNTILGARGMGISGMVSAFSNAMAQRTQQLLNSVQVAQQNRDFAWNKAQSLGNMAMNFSQLKEQMDEFGKNYGLEQNKLKEQKYEFGQNLKFQQDTNSYLQAAKARQQMSVAAKNFKSFDDFYGAVKDNPALAGMSSQDIYDLYTSNGGKGNISDKLQRTSGIRTGSIMQDVTSGTANSGELFGGAVKGAATAAGLGGELLNGLSSVGLLGEGTPESALGEGINVFDLLGTLGKGILGFL